MEDWIKAGKIAAEVLDYGRRLIKIDSSILDVVEKIESKIISFGGQPAFPVNISINYIAAHYTAYKDDKTKFKENDLVKLDIGVHVNGAIGDNAATIDLGNNKELVLASRNALDEGVKIAKEGTQAREIGYVIQNKIQEFNFSPVINLSGHRLDRFKVHAGLTIPNYDNGDKTKLEKDMIIAIEPFATTGKGEIFESSNATLYSVVKKKGIRSPMTRDVFKEIESFHGLPFTTRWLTRKFPKGKVAFALKELMQSGIIRDYPPLPEVAKGVVSQAEHTIRVDEKIEILTKGSV